MEEKRREYQFFSIALWAMHQIPEFPVYPFAVEECIRNLPRKYGEKHSSNLLLIFLISGNLHYICAGKDFWLNPDELLIIPHNAEYVFESSAKTVPYHKLVLEIRGSMLDSIADSMNLVSPMKIHLEEPEQWVWEVKMIGELLQKNHSGDIPLIIGKTHQILCQSSMRQNPNHDFPAILQQAITLMNNSRESALSLKDIAKELHISLSSLGRLFRGYLHISPRDYYIRRKLELASYLLKGTSLSVKEIAFRTGYCNQFHFSTEFRRIMKITPSEFRKQSSVPPN